MNWDWQQLIALLCVAVALFVLGRRVVRLWRGASKPGCGACATCPVQEGATVPQSKPLVALDLRSPARGIPAADVNTPARHNGSAAH
jgi:hypothetical protein